MEPGFVNRSKRRLDRQKQPQWAEANFTTDVTDITDGIRGFGRRRGRETAGSQRRHEETKKTFLPQRTLSSRRWSLNHESFRRGTTRISRMGPGFFNRQQATDFGSPAAAASPPTRKKFFREIFAQYWQCV